MIIITYKLILQKAAASTPRFTSQELWVQEMAVVLRTIQPIINFLRGIRVILVGVYLQLNPQVVPLIEAILQEEELKLIVCSSL